jgi:hypothetical protein
MENCAYSDVYANTRVRKSERASEQKRDALKCGSTRECLRSQLEQLELAWPSVFATAFCRADACLLIYVFVQTNI